MRVITEKTPPPPPKKKKKKKKILSYNELRCKLHIENYSHGFTAYQDPVAAVSLEPDLITLSHRDGTNQTLWVI